MTQRNEPTFLYHFTHIDHLPTLVGRGLLSDNGAQASGVLAVEVGNTSIKDRRRGQSVPVGDGGGRLCAILFRAPQSDDVRDRQWKRIDLFRRHVPTRLLSHHFGATMRRGNSSARD